VGEHSLSVQKGCKCVGLSRAAYYKGIKREPERDAEVIAAINGLLEKHARWGFWKCYKALKKKHPWNHKRVYRVYCKMRLNQKRRAKRRLPKRIRQPLMVPQRPNHVWSADFMSDALYAGSRFRGRDSG
jgi:putative transposase